MPPSPGVRWQVPCCYQSHQPCAGGSHADTTLIGWRASGRRVTDTLAGCVPTGAMLLPIPLAVCRWESCRYHPHWVTRQWAPCYLHSRQVCAGRRHATTSPIGRVSVGVMPIPPSLGGARVGDVLLTPSSGVRWQAPCYYQSHWPCAGGSADTSPIRHTPPGLFKTSICQLFGSEAVKRHRLALGTQRARSPTGNPP